MTGRPFERHAARTVGLDEHDVRLYPEMRQYIIRRSREFAGIFGIISRYNFYAVFFHALRTEHMGSRRYDHAIARRGELARPRRYERGLCSRPGDADHRVPGKCQLKRFRDTVLSAF